MSNGSDQDFWLLPGDANEDEGLLLWPAGRCSIREKPIEFQEIYCRDLDCICNEVKLLAIDHANGRSHIVTVGLRFAPSVEDERAYRLTWSGSFEPDGVRSAFTKVLETEPDYFDHLSSMHGLIRRAVKHQLALVSSNGELIKT